MTKEKIDKFDFIKIKNFCDNTENGKNILKSYIYNGLVSRIYKEHLQLNFKNRNNPI